MSIVEFVCWVAVVGLATAFLYTLGRKWGWLEWLQVHAPSNFLHQLFSCPFCCNWWMGLVVAVFFVTVTGRAEIIFAPVFSAVWGARLCG